MTARASSLSVSLALILSSLLATSCVGEETQPSRDDVEEDLESEDGDERPDEGTGDNITGAQLPAASVAIAKEGDTLIAEDGFIAAIVPAIGGGVSAIVELEDGSSKSMTIVHDPVNGVRILSPDSEIESDAAMPSGVTAQAASSSPGACADKAFSLMGHRWSTTYAWRFRSGSTPKASSTKKNAETALKRAVANISGSQNNCSVAKAAGTPSASYLGRTSLHTQVIGTKTSFKCGNGDGKNVVGFGLLPGSVVGLACVWWSGNHLAVEADVKLSTARRWFAAGSTPGGCSSRLSIEGVATHEFGHVFGLGHVSESKHGNLTMSTATRSCTISDTTLGRGDVLGLRKLYP